DRGGGGGKPVLDPATGDDVTVTFGPPAASGSWTPTDPRDVVTPDTDIPFTSTGSGANGSFVAKSITIIKQASLQTDVDQTGLTPGDTLRYTLNLAISDFFAF